MLVSLWKGLKPKKKLNRSLNGEIVQVEKTNKLVPGSIPRGKLHTFLPCRKVDWVGEHSLPAQGPFSIWMWRVERQHTCASLEPVRPEKSAQGTAGVLSLSPKENQTAQVSPV